MADFFLNTLGEAFDAVVKYVASTCVDGTTPTSGWAVSYNPAVDALAPCFRLLSSVDAQNNRWYINEGLSAPYLPVRYLATQQGTNRDLVISATGTDEDFVTFNNAASQLAFAIYYVIGQLSGYTIAEIASSGQTFDGRAAVGYLRFGWLLYQGEDQVFVTTSCYNPAMGPIPYGFRFGNSQLFVPGPVSNVTQVVNIPPQPLPQDLDVSVNQGQAILSINSRTTTILP